MMLEETQNKLTIILDTESLDKYYCNHKDQINKMLSYYNRFPFLFMRIKGNCNNKIIREIVEIPPIADNLQNKFNETFFNSINIIPKNERQKEFIHSIFQFGHHKNPNYLHNLLFVTENDYFLEKYITSKSKIDYNQINNFSKWHKENIKSEKVNDLLKDNSLSLSLKDFIPNLLLTNCFRALEVMDLFAKDNGIYFGIKDFQVKNNWYELFIHSKLPHVPMDQSSLSTFHYIIPLIFRLLKLMLSIDYLGIEHYFGNRKKNIIDPEMAMDALDNLNKNIIDENNLQGFLDRYNAFILFYHTEYLISIISGIFDNLALETESLYQIKSSEKKKLDKIRISLNSNNGKEFLIAIREKNKPLKDHIDNYRDFINLVYSFREKVIHTEGLSQIVHPIVIGWSNLIPISEEIKKYIDQCKDEKSEYKIITRWGIILDRFDNQNLYLDPYYFSVKLLATTLKFTDQYLKLLGIPSSSKLNILKTFREDNLRDYF